MSFSNSGHYAELSGKLDFEGSYRPDAEAKVVLSAVTHGSHVGTTAPGIGIKYVARGTEYYKVGNRTFAVRAGQFLCMSQGLAHEGGARGGGETTLGLCIYLPEAGITHPERDAHERPLLFSANCSPLGRLLEGKMKELMRPAADRPAVARNLLGSLSTHLEPLLAETATALEALPTVKLATRYEALRKLSVARGHLHDVTDRPVELAELAGVAGMSRFQLLRYFKDCYGEPPAAYHRRLRLELAHQAVQAKRLSCSEAAHRFGFADAASFSHAYRRVFGAAPVRSLRA
jgi:AraC-like DNA-binding protein